MTDPVYVDLRGDGPDDDETPAWKRYWQGREALWKAFWIAFVFGHGAVLGIVLGTMVMVLLLGLISSPTDPSRTLSFFFMAGAGLAVGLAVPFGIWSGVAVWRSAWNCIDRRWGVVARGAVLLYALAWIVPLLNLMTDNWESGK